MQYQYTNAAVTTNDLNINTFDGQVEACKVAQYPFSATQPIQELDWEVAHLLIHWKRELFDSSWLLDQVYLKETANQIVQEQSPRKLAEVFNLHNKLIFPMLATCQVRTRLYELIAHCIPPEVIFVGIQKELVKVCDGELKTELCQMAAFYEHRLQKGNKAIYHLEAFVAKFMAIYMKFMEDTCGGF